MSLIKNCQGEKSDQPRLSICFIAAAYLLLICLVIAAYLSSVPLTGCIAALFFSLSFLFSNFNKSHLMPFFSRMGYRDWLLIFFRIISSWLLEELVQALIWSFKELNLFMIRTKEVTWWISFMHRGKLLFSRAPRYCWYVTCFWFSLRPFGLEAFGKQCFHFGSNSSHWH